MHFIMSDSTDLSGLIIFLIVSGIAIFLIVFFSVLNKKKNNRVLSTSLYVKNIIEMNKKYTFLKLRSTSDTRYFRLSSKRSFDTFDFQRRRNEFVRSNMSYYQDLVRQVNFNETTYAEYKKEISQVKLLNDESIAKNNKMSLKAFNKREIKLGSKLIKHPQLNYRLRIVWEYTSPAGRNHYSNYRDSTIYDIRGMVSVNETSSSNKTQQNRYNPSKREPSERVYTIEDLEAVED